MKNGYFHVSDAKVSGDKIALSGNYIVADTLEVSTGGNASSGGASSPPIKPLAPFTVKWILPPRTSHVYDTVKSAAEGAGYETVEHDDFSYPPPRT